MRKPPAFVPAADVRRGRRDATAVLAEIRRLYFEARRRTIGDDFARAIELLKSLPSQSDRERATVFMHGLDQLRREWDANVGRRRPSARRRAGGAGTGKR